MTVVTLFPTHVAILTHCNELVVECTAPQCSNIKGNAPTIRNALLHWQGLGRIPASQDIGITCKIETLALGKTCYIEREGHTAVVPVDAWFVEHHPALVEEAEKVCLLIIPDR